MINHDFQDGLACFGCGKVCRVNTEVRVCAVVEKMIYYVLHIFCSDSGHHEHMYNYFVHMIVYGEYVDNPGKCFCVFNMMLSYERTNRSLVYDVSCISTVPPIIMSCSKTSRKWLQTCCHKRCIYQYSQSK